MLTDLAGVCSSEQILQEAEACDLATDLSGGREEHIRRWSPKLPLQLLGAIGNAQGGGRLVLGEYNEDSGCAFFFQEGLQYGAAGGETEGRMVPKALCPS